jgi:hypothetical protein
VPVFADPVVGKTDGHVSLTWSLDEDADAEVTAYEFELQSAPDAAFDGAATVYLGPDRASFRSGLTRGVHHFRVRARPAPSQVAGEPWSEWSEPVDVLIEPYELWQAWSLFGVGAVLVGSILAYLFTADRRSRREERAT